MAEPTFPVKVKDPSHKSQWDGTDWTSKPWPTYQTQRGHRLKGQLHPPTNPPEGPMQYDDVRGYDPD